MPCHITLENVVLGASGSLILKISDLGKFYGPEKVKFCPEEFIVLKFLQAI